MNDFVKSRERFSMDKGWRFHLGDVNIDWGKRHDEVYNFVKAGGTVGPAQADWNDSEWKLVDLPHDWIVGMDFDKDAGATLGYKSPGIGWYRKCFCLEKEDKGKQILLEFDGIATNSIVYFNGSIIERNWSGYNSFAVDISDRAFFGNKQNVLAIKVDSTFGEGWWYEGAGIYRHTWLTKKSQIHIAHWGTWVNPERLINGEWITNIETTMENSSYEEQDFTLVSKLINPQGEVVGSTETKSNCASIDEKVIKQSIVINQPWLWDIESPNLYKLVSEVYQDGKLVDDDETTYGYRTLKFCAETGFYLNDRPVKIKGTCNHQDHAGVGVALPDSIHEYRIRRLKEMGSNTYRCAHNNPAKELLDACDRFGMLVMDENRNFETNSEVINKQVKAMVKRDRNHPCVIMYSIFNEELHQGTPQGRAMAKRLMHVVKKMDNTRPVLGALNGGIMEDEGTADILDITGVNYQLDIFDAFHEKHPGQLIIGSENTSTFSTRGVYISDREKHVFSCYDEEKAPWGASIRNTWKAVNTRKFVLGMFSWTGFDYRGEPSPYVWPSVSTFFGSLDTCGFAKDGFYMHKACWASKPMVHILPHWNWSGMEGKPIRVMSHTNCDEVELFLNGTSLGRKASPIYEQATWEIPYEPGTLIMKGYIKGSLSAEDKVETTGEAVALRLEADRNSIYGDGMDAVPINVCAVDSQGRFVPIADNKVRFIVMGLGAIIGVGNGDPNSHEADSAEERHLFNGRCQSILQSLEGVGSVTVRVESEGLEYAEYELEVIYKEPRKIIPSTSDVHLVSWRMTNQLFLEKPDPNMEVSASDMNTWEPLLIGDGPQSKFKNSLDYYALYRTAYNAPFKGLGENAALHFYKVMGYVEVYVNGEKAAEKDCMWGNELEIPFKNGLSGKIIITVLIKCNNSWNGNAGICGAVVVRK